MDCSRPDLLDNDRFGFVTDGGNGLKLATPHFLGTIALFRTLLMTIHRRGNSIDIDGDGWDTLFFKQHLV